MTGHEGVELGRIAEQPGVVRVPGARRQPVLCEVRAPDIVALRRREMWPRRRCCVSPWPSEACRAAGAGHGRDGLAAGVGIVFDRTPDSSAPPERAAAVRLSDLAVVLVLGFTAPEMGRFSGCFDWLMTMVVFPFVVMAGAARERDTMPCWMQSRMSVDGAAIRCKSSTILPLRYSRTRYGNPALEL